MTHSKEHDNSADLALLDPLLQDFTLTGTISSAFLRASYRWQDKLDRTSSFRARPRSHRSQRRHLNLESWLPDATEDDVSLVSEALLGLA
jgi:hypothetical protein